MTQPGDNDALLRRQLFTLRIIWAALLLGPIMFILVVLLAIFPNRAPEAQSMDMSIFRIVSIAMIATMLPTAYIVRAVIYGKRDEYGTIPIARYSTANILFWAMSEGAAFFPIVCMLLDGKPLPFLALAFIPLVNNLINFPTGGRVTPVGPRPIHDYNQPPRS
jgi:hypothetical protein